MKQLEMLKYLLQLDQNQMQTLLIKFLNKHYTKVINKKNYIIAVGNIPIGLVAHMDTVFKQPPKNFFYDNEEQVLWSPDGGLGADDRAGIYAIIKIIEAGFRPHIIFTRDEEIGGFGAKSLIKNFPISPFKNLKCLIELDRQGKDDSVYYQCNNENFEDYINKFGFITDWGTFTDISIIAPQWKVAAVNLSVGYFNEHSAREYLKINFLNETIEKVINILKNEPVMSKYEYIPFTIPATNRYPCTCILCDTKLKIGEGYAVPGLDTYTYLCKQCNSYMLSY